MQGRAKDVIRPAREEVPHVDDDAAGDGSGRVVDSSVGILDLEAADGVLVEEGDRPVVYRAKGKR